MFIELHSRKYDIPVFVNADHIISIQVNDEQITHLYFSSKDYITVKESYQEVKRMIRGGSN